MTSSQLNPSQHVERIREILIGRDLQQMHGRISRIEGTLQQDGAPVMASSDFQKAITSLRNEQTALRMEIQALKNHSASATRTSFVDSQTGSPDEFASEMAARIDARFREILSHLQNELLQWKGQIDEDLHSLCETKADRSELKSRFARLAGAAMDDESDKKHNEGFLL